MKRTVFIFGILIILILAGVLAFLLIASDDQKKDIFSAFDFGDGTDSAVIFDTIVDAITPGEDRLAALRQLTLKRVIGAIELTPTASSTATMVYYAEAGTGHIFSLDIVTGAENRLSNITVPAANEAVLSARGDFAITLSGGRSDGRVLTLITLPEGGRELSSITFSERVKQATLTTDGMVLYTTVAQNNLLGRSYDITSGQSRTIFTLPFKEATVRFPVGSKDSTYVYPKTAATLESYLYEINGGVLSRLPLSGYGLTAAAHENTVLLAARQSGSYTSLLYDTTTKRKTPLSLNVIAEKCTFIGDAATLYCGSSFDVDVNTPIEWYQGIRTTRDNLFRVNGETGDMVNLIDLGETSQRDIDVRNLTGSLDAVRLYFINHIDGTLWIYDQSLQ